MPNLNYPHARALGLNSANEFAINLNVIDRNNPARARPATIFGRVVSANGQFLVELVRVESTEDGSNLSLTTNEHELCLRHLFERFRQAESESARIAMINLSNKIKLDEYGPPNFATKRDGAVQRRKDGLELANMVIAMDARSRQGLLPQSWARSGNMVYAAHGAELHTIMNKLVEAMRSIRGSHYEQLVNRANVLLSRLPPLARR